MSGRKAERGDLPLRTRQDVEAARNSVATEPPRALNPQFLLTMMILTNSTAPYDEKDHDIPDVVSFPKALLEIPHVVTPTELVINGGKGVRVGVRSHDQRLYCAAAGGHLEEVKRLLESGYNPSDRTVCDWCPLVCFLSIYLGVDRNTDICVIALGSPQRH